MSSVESRFIEPPSLRSTLTFARTLALTALAVSALMPLMPSETHAQYGLVLHLLADHERPYVYGVTEATETIPALLLFINGETEAVEIMMAAGSNPTDVSVNYGEGRLYISNWGTNETHVFDLINRLRLSSSRVDNADSDGDEILDGPIPTFDEMSAAGSPPQVLALGILARGLALAAMCLAWGSGDRGRRWDRVRSKRFAWAESEPGLVFGISLLGNLERGPIRPRPAA